MDSNKKANLTLVFTLLPILAGIILFITQQAYIYAVGWTFATVGFLGFIIQLMRVITRRGDFNEQ